MDVKRDGIEIVVDGEALAKAIYPVTIDPVIGANDFLLTDVGGLGNTNSGVFPPEIAFNPSLNEYLVVYAADENADTRTEIYGQLVDAETGAELTPNDFLIGEMVGLNGTGNDSDRPEVAYNSTKTEYLVCYRGDFNAGIATELDIFVQRIDANGDLLTSAGAVTASPAPLQVSDMGAPGENFLDAFKCDVAYNPTDDEYLVVWYGDDALPADGGVGDSPSDNEAFGQLLEYSGNTLQELGTDFRISDIGGRRRWEGCRIRDQCGPQQHAK